MRTLPKSSITGPGSEYRSQSLDPRACFDTPWATRRLGRSDRHQVEAKRKSLWLSTPASPGRLHFLLCHCFLVFLGRGGWGRPRPFCSQVVDSNEPLLTLVLRLQLIWSTHVCYNRQAILGLAQPMNPKRERLNVCWWSKVRFSNQYNQCLQETLSRNSGLRSILTSTQAKVTERTHFNRTRKFVH